MRRILLQLLLCLIFIPIAFTQTVPQGMKYQAVARDLSGHVLANQRVTLQINLYTGIERLDPVYSETHTAITNDLGLFNLTIGKGFVESGKFENVPWSSNEIWMEIAIRDREDGGFTTISDSKMLSVPYAFHAETAAELLGTGGRGEGETPPGNPHKWWRTIGNRNMTKGFQLGTVDRNELVIVTMDEPRIIIDSKGPISALSQFSVENQEPTILTGDLSVDQATWLNDILTVQGEADFNNSLNVNFGSSTYLSGSLDVDGITSLHNSLTVYNKQPTLLSGTLTVDLETDLNNALNVDGMTNLNSSLNVNYNSPVLFTGSLQTEGPATFMSPVQVKSPEESISETTGALVVQGGAGIVGNLYVGGKTGFKGEVNFTEPVAFLSDEQSYSANDGAVTVKGGVGIGKNLAVEGYQIIGKADGLGAEFAGFPLIVNNGNNGIVIRIDEPRTAANDFLAFYDKEGMQGRIEGQTTGELWSDPEYLLDIGFQTANVLIGGWDVFVASTDVIRATADLAAATTDIRVCANVGGPCITPPSFGTIAAKVADLALQVANLVVVIGNEVIVIAEEAAYITFKNVNIGVSYSSGAGDYAEWIPKQAADLKLFPGDVVGIIDGKVSRTTQGADYVMVVTSAPIVVGNMPPEGQEHLYEKVAFMGQVPVKVFGQVELGDYILPSRLNNGFGVGVAADEMEVGDYKQIIGVAWSSSESDYAGVVNVAVGLNANDISTVVASQEEQLSAQQLEIARLQEQVAQISMVLNELAQGGTIKSIEFLSPELDMSAPDAPHVASASTEYSTSEDVIVTYFEVTREHIVQGLALAEEQLRISGMNPDDHPFFRNLKENPAQKAQLVDALKNSIEIMSLRQAEEDRQAGSQVEFAYEPSATSSEAIIPSHVVEIGFEIAMQNLETRGVDLSDNEFINALKTDQSVKERFIQQIQTQLNSVGQNPSD